MRSFSPIRATIVLTFIVISFVALLGRVAYLQTDGRKHHHLAAARATAAYDRRARGTPRLHLRPQWLRPRLHHPATHRLRRSQIHAGTNRAGSIKPHLTPPSPIWPRPSTRTPRPWRKTQLKNPTAASFASLMRSKRTGEQVHPRSRHSRRRFSAHQYPQLSNGFIGRPCSR